MSRAVGHPYRYLIELVDELTTTPGGIEAN
jgi:hypothetical protein